MVDDCKGILTFEDAVKAIQEAHHTEVTGLKNEINIIQNNLKVAQNELSLARKDNAKLSRKLESVKLKLITKQKEAKWLRESLIKNDITVMTEPLNIGEDPIINSSMNFSTDISTDSNKKIKLTVSSVHTTPNEDHNTPATANTNTITIDNIHKKELEHEELPVDDDLNSTMVPGNHDDQDSCHDGDYSPSLLQGSYEGTVTNREEYEGECTSIQGTPSPPLLGGDMEIKTMNENLEIEATPKTHQNVSSRRKKKRKVIQTTLTQSLLQPPLLSTKEDLHINDAVDVLSTENIIPPTPTLDTMKSALNTYAGNESLDVTRAVFDELPIQDNIKSTTSPPIEKEGKPLTNAQKLAKRAGLPLYEHVCVIRKKDDRSKLDAKPCQECAKWFECNDIYKDKQAHLKKACRHKKLFHPPDTDPRLWNISFPDD